MTTHPLFPLPEGREITSVSESSEVMLVCVTSMHTSSPCSEEVNMVRQRKHEQLHSRMEEATSSGIAELKSFVAGVERDYDAVKEALRPTWSQDITEGKVNKLKTLKRVMYGRAGFPLSRQRLLHNA